MKGTPAIYLGKLVDKTKFRTNIYDTNGKKKLVESWAEFEAAMQSGLWFATREDAMESMEMAKELEQSEGDATPTPKSKPKSKSKPKAKPMKVEEVEDDEDFLSDAREGDVFEVTDENR
jgi:hypothetical protein